ncbi:bifunctional diaminohydroxyphosphoribosylaminopyrimidine deaminase/5-amino-6-(5-phosphoribosylamino)uracil reductase RibD [Macrococcoides caseolyticum]|uniref:bifunctional diaminohydroxyphosphoribosylaminopyrimidine deaminase/5-amino-6-(5-phosphoribosylamino)uracil reductase RibD n=1 Tax=Macrococcoides caseolyticum TaxID=69966 RepID=UPI001EEE8824|nr:bifunctional diaminohydroxyphosphoribosylaminopyrimidine deaminase/5-amino-6-(5-phosphoribosylamino)uracil reductase RibD [Macrococcus caseolyticus]MCE4956408.1 bifunctional diaminohydroxyphosphoribosylaminopyrimidine deaminase/5-amino-6-(5-phosphoribosylamino)uracil reductase RibD [Macrococcus caseolyticus]
MNKLYIDKAFELVKWTDGQTGSNPAVGCIIVKDNKIVGIGAHLIEGEGHAEVNAINMAGERAFGATLYCTLEPCSHYGKTPPCTKKIIESGIKRVVFAARDLTLQSGIEEMQSNGIEVAHSQVHEIEAYYQPFFNAKLHKMPYTILKMGVTLDGKTADDQNVSQWITNAESRRHAHQVRYSCDAILVGYGTYKHDQPTLDSRDYKDKWIRKVVISNGRFEINDKDNNDYDKSRLIVVTNVQQTIEDVLVIVLPELTPEAILKALYLHKINRLIIEGGMQTIRLFASAHCYDEIHQYIAPKLLGGSSKHQFLTTDEPSKMSAMTPLQLVTVKTFEDDVLLVYRKDDSDVHRHH